MQPFSNIQISRHGIYYLRIQRNGLDHRISLRTRDPDQAAIAAAISHATLSRMKIDPTKIKRWTLKSDGQNVEITTEDNDSDRESAQFALEKILEKMALISQKPVTATELTTKPKATISLAEAIAEYKIYIEKKDSAVKTKAALGLV